MSKMGISVVQSYRGAPFFEAVGLRQEFVDIYFTWMPTRIGGLEIQLIEEDLLARHMDYLSLCQSSSKDLEDKGDYH